ncbi:MAG: AMP-binding protein, partial [Spirochaetia bacterium]|nr:AMP-binding protein [Spirochaetia bacterium]
GVIKNVNAAPPVKQKLFAAAYFCAKNFKDGFNFLTFQTLDIEGRNPLQSLMVGVLSFFKVVFLFVPYLLLDTIVLKKIRGAFGGRLRLTISGGGALPNHVDHFFNNIGVKVLEGYGLTETCPVLAVRTESKNIIGTVGPIWPQTELRLVDIASGEIIYPPRKGVMGEIHVRGPQVMKGYNKNQKATDEVLKDGWLNTGDLGVITFKDCLKIVGRSKETIVLLGGENVEPTPIETKILALAEIEQCMVVGQDKKTLGALVVPSVEFFKNYGKDVAEISKSPEVQQKVLEAIKNQISAVNGFKSFERIIDCRLLPKMFEVGDELTASYKVKRHTVSDKYKKVIESMY